MSSTSHTIFTQPIHSTDYRLQHCSCQLLALVCYVDEGIFIVRVALLGIQYMLVVSDLYRGRALM